jgi:hypothetical protein
MSTLNRESANNVIEASASFQNAIRSLATLETNAHATNVTISEWSSEERERGDVNAKQVKVTTYLARAILKATDHEPGSARARTVVKPLKAAWFAALTPAGKDKPISAARKSWDSAWHLVDSEAFAALREGTTIKAFETAVEKIVNAKGKPVDSRGAIVGWVKAQRSEAVRLAEVCDTFVKAFRAQSDGTLPDPADLAAHVAEAIARASAAETAAAA